MKRLLVFLLLIGLLSGCSGKSNVDAVLALREKFLKGNGCNFSSTITADYGDRTYTFVMQNTADKNGNLTFQVKSPDSISGITGEIAQQMGKLTFDDTVLAFPLMADEQITPISAPWIFIKALRSGYIHACEETDEGLHVIIDDSYEENALRLDVWLNEEDVPIRSEFSYKGRRIITLDVENFTIL